MSAHRLGPIQKLVIECLEESDYWESVYEISMSIFHEDDNQPNCYGEMRSVYEALVRLRRRGLVVSRWTWMRDIGRVLVWRSSTRSNQKVIDPGF